MFFTPITPDRPYRIRFEHRPWYLYIAVQCDVTNYAIAKKYWTEILAMQSRRHYERVLIDKDVASSMPLQDVVMLVSEIMNLGCHDVRFAIYDRNYDAERCAVEEMVGTNRGLKVRMCATFEEAQTWLFAGDSHMMPATSPEAPRIAA